MAVSVRQACSILAAAGGSCRPVCWNCVSAQALLVCCVVLLGRGGPGSRGPLTCHETDERIPAGRGHSHDHNGHTPKKHCKASKHENDCLWMRKTCPAVRLSGQRARSSLICILLVSELRALRPLWKLRAGAGCSPSVRDSSPQPCPRLTSIIALICKCIRKAPHNSALCTAHSRGFQLAKARWERAWDYFSTKSDHNTTDLAPGTCTAQRRHIDALDTEDNATAASKRGGLRRARAVSPWWARLGLAQP